MAGEHLILKVVDQGKGPEGHLVIKKNAKITWNSSSQFYIKFDKGNNPCVASTYQDPDIYPSEEHGKLFSVNCMVKDPVPDPMSFPYSIKAGPPPTPTLSPTPTPGPTPYPPGPTGNGNGHCEGCCLETDGTF